MSVKDGADWVAQSIESILRQEDIAFEFIIVNDGSSDNIGEKLSQFQRADNRIKITEQRHKGLTRSLMEGCKQARGKYIARQDGGGDISLPGRLLAQYETLENHNDAVMICSGARFVGPAGEYLYETIISQSELDRGLESLRMKDVRGPPHHGSTMIRSTAYRQTGGYRSAFYVAQDLDLWLRLYEIGKIIADKTIRYVAAVHPADISRLYRKKQLQTTEFILEAARLRRLGREDSEILNRVGNARHTRPGMGVTGGLNNNSLEARGLYFIGSCINAKDNDRARHYYRLALRKNPLHIRALVRLVSTYLG